MKVLTLRDLLAHFFNFFYNDVQTSPLFIFKLHSWSALQHTRDVLWANICKLITQFLSMFSTTQLERRTESIWLSYKKAI
jgi:hypothetical protein